MFLINNTTLTGHDYKNILQYLPHAGIICSTDNIIKVNQKTCELFGYSSKELINQSIKIFFAHQHEQTYLLIKEYLSLSPTTTENQDQLSLEITAKHKNKIEFPINITLGKITKNDKILSIIIIHNITYPTEYTQKLMEDHNFVSLINNIIASSRLQYSLEDNLQSALKAICKFWNWELGHIFLYNQEKKILEGKALWINTGKILLLDDIKYPPQKPITYSPKEGWIGQVLYKKQPSLTRNFKYNKLFQYKDIPFGQLIKTGYAIPIFINANIIAVMDFYTSDEIDSQKIDNIMEKIARQMATIIHDKNKEEFLLMLSKSAITEAKIKAEFLAKMSHELRTPIHSILGINHLLMSSNLIKEQHNWCKMVEKSATDLTKIIDDILDVTKIGLNKIKLNIEEINFYNLLKELSDVFSIQILEKKLTFSIDADTSIPITIKIDKYRIQQIIMNLVTNAIKFTEKGSISIIARTILDNNKISLECSIKDTGKGIKASKIKGIFNKFEQSNPDDYVIGTGLGLSIVEGLIKLMKGTILVQSKLEQGSCFTFKIPISAPKIEYPQIKISIDSIIILDNNPIDIEILHKYLTKTNARIIKPKTTEKLKEATKHCSPQSLIIINYNYIKDSIEELAPYLNKHKVIIILDAHSIIIKNNLPFIYHRTIKPIISNNLINKINLIYQNKAQIENLPTIKQESETAPPLNLTGFKILIVDDVESNQVFLKIFLEKKGAIVDTALSGMEALEKIKTTDYNLIFLDYHMPQMNGLETTKNIRQIERRNQKNKSKIALVTANVFVKNNTDYINNEIDGCINKPINLNNIEKIIQSIIESAV